MEATRIFQPERTSNNKFRFSLFNIGFILLIILSQYNLAKWGASISYVAIPGVFFLLGAILNKFKFDKNAFLILLLYVVFFISTVFSNYVDFGREMVSFFFFCLFFIFIVSNDFSLKEIQVFILVYILVSITVSANICYQWLSGNYLQDWTKRSTFVLFGVSKDPNYAFVYLSPAFILSFLVLFFSKRKLVKIFCLLSLAITSFALLCASSRAGMLAIIASMLMVPIFCQQLKLKTRLIVFFVTVAIIGIGVLVILKTYNDYALKRMFEDKTGAGRIQIWNSALTVFRSNPIIGGGFNSGTSASMEAIGYATHSIFIDIICDSGVLGLAAFLLFYFKNCFWPNWDNFEVMAVLSISALVPMLFINGFNTTTFFFPMIFLSVINKRLKINSYSELLNI